MDNTPEIFHQDDPRAYPRCVGDYVCDPDFVKIGGYGIVFRGRDVHDPDRVVAIKFLKADYAKIASVRGRFVHEGRLLQQLSHRNCIRIFDANEQGDFPYIVMEFIEGKNAGEMKSDCGLDRRTAAMIVAQAARGLHHAHTRDRPIIHRDIKPSNILYDPAKTRAVVTDFGLAKCLFESGDESAAAAATPLTPFGIILPSTPFYMPPEYLEPGHGDVIKPAADIYSLGATFYELLCGRPPYPVDAGDGLNGNQALAEIKFGALPKALPSNVPKAFELVCDRAMKRKPGDRYKSAAHLAEALEAALFDSLGGPPRPSLIFRMVMAVVVLVVVATVTTAVILHGHTTDQGHELLPVPNGPKDSSLPGKDTPRARRRSNRRR